MDLLTKELCMETSKEVLKIGQKLVDYCKRGESSKAIEELYGKDIESQEAMSAAGMPDHMRGIDAIRRKNKEWEDTMEVHSVQVDGPFPLGERFAVHFKYDTTDKNTQKKMEMEEVALYTVKDGKIVKEEFFYTM
jgi:ketosteroid isomerase-like protein